MIIAIVVGWVLFVIITILYFVGNKINVKEEQSLAFLCLAILLSNEFRNGMQQSLENQRNSHIFKPDRSTKDVVYLLVMSIQEAAKNSSSDTIPIVCALVEKMRNK